MGFLQKQKRILTAFCIFLAFMFICTLVSRAVYASGLPQVSVEKPKRMTVNHKVEAEGIVHQGREYAVNVLSGLRVRTVYAHVGDRVEADTVLFEIDLDDLKEQIKEQELAIQKLQLQISDQEKNRALEEQERQSENARAQADYERISKEAEKSIDKAEDEAARAREELKRKEENPVTVTSEEDRKAAVEAYNAWVQERDRLKEALDQAKKDYEEAPDDQKDEKKKAYEAAEQAYNAYTENPVKEPDFSAEDNARAEWEAEKNSLKDKAEAASDSVDAAKRSGNDSVIEAERKIEDGNKAKPADSSLEINRLELSALKEKLASYQEVLNREGQICPETEGIITRIQVSPGERVPDGAAVVYADLFSPMQFHVTLTKEQKKYVNQGEEATLSFGGSAKGEYTVDYIAESEQDPSLYEACIFLPDGVGSIGQSGTFEVEAHSETFSCCIPVSALWEDANHRKYVYIVSEKEGILGKELAAEIVYVKVLDQNDTWAAIEEGVIDSETELIVSSTEPLNDRDVIRYRE